MVTGQLRPTPIKRKVFPRGDRKSRILCGVMVAFLFVLTALFSQGGPVLTNQNGIILGILRTADGAPAVGVRVSALARPEAINDLAAAASFAGLGETDAAGRYRLENIPPGQYYIVAGRVDAPTYYPGTVQAGEGKVVSVTPGLTVSSIDFVLNPGSAGRANGSSAGPSWVVPVQTRIEGGGKVPLFAAGRFPTVRLAGIDVPLLGPSLTLGVPSPIPDYRVTVENLPETYELRSLTFGSTDLKVNALKLPKPASGSVVTESIVVTLAPRANPQSSGVRVSGQIAGDPKRSITISGSPGTIYTDGSFEFVAVPPGRHTIVTTDSPGAGRSQGATLVVGDRDLSGIELEEVSVAPAIANLPTGNRLPGARSKTASIRGRVMDGDTHEPFNAGRVALNGNYSMVFPLDDDGRFEVPKLLPGRYVVEALVYGIGTVSREVLVDEQDVAVELSLK